MAEAEVGIFGGSGFYAFLEDVEEVEVETPYGKASGPFVVGEIEGKQVAFLPRHGRKHELPPHAIPCRANVWAMKELGVQRILGPNACGSLQEHVKPGDFVVCDQIVDRTRTRPHTFYDGPQTTHISFADPYCPTMRELTIRAMLHEAAAGVRGDAEAAAILAGDIDNPALATLVLAAGTG